jgi:hypothetical protein
MIAPPPETTWKWIDRLGCRNDPTPRVHRRSQSHGGLKTAFQLEARASQPRGASRQAGSVRISL